MKQIISWIYFKSPFVVGALLGLYALWYTHTALEPFTHGKRITDLDRLVMVALLDTESGERGFLLTGDPRFLEQYRLGLRGLEDFEPIYGELLIDQRSKAAFAELEKILRSQINYMALSIKIHDEIGADAAIALIRDKRGLNWTKEVYNLRMKIRNTESSASPLLQFLPLPSESSRRSWGS